VPTHPNLTCPGMTKYQDRPSDQHAAVAQLRHCTARWGLSNDSYVLRHFDRDSCPAVVRGTAPIAAAALAPKVQTLFFDAVFTHARTAGPGVTQVGHQQIVAGGLRDARGRRAGGFSFTCTWTRVERGHASEKCIASASTADGRLDAAGPSQSNSLTHTWRLTGGTDRYRDASGTRRRA